MTTNKDAVIEAAKQAGGENTGVGVLMRDYALEAFAAILSAPYEQEIARLAAMISRYAVDGMESDLVAAANRGRIAAEGRVAELEAESQAKQAKIDSLMLEYCPDEMTAGQTAEWARHQKPAPDVFQAMGLPPVPPLYPQPRPGETIIVEYVAQPEQGPTTTFPLLQGGTIVREHRGEHPHGWLLYAADDKLIRGLNGGECDLIDSVLAAVAHPTIKDSGDMEFFVHPLNDCIFSEKKWNQRTPPQSVTKTEFGYGYGKAEDGAGGRLAGNTPGTGWGGYGGKGWRDTTRDKPELPDAKPKATKGNNQL